MIENEFSVNEFIVREIGYPGVIKKEVVEELVRCEDCKHRDAEDGSCKGRGWPIQLVPDDGFCDKGERTEKYKYISREYLRRLFCEKAGAKTDKEIDEDEETL